MLLLSVNIEMLNVLYMSRARFASAAGGDKTRVFFGLNRQYSLRDRRIKAGPPQPRKLPFHRIGVNPPGTKYFCRDFKNPSLANSNASFSIEYRPFIDTEAMEKSKTALERVLPGCRITLVPTESREDSFRIVRKHDNRTVFERPPETTLNLQLGDLKELIGNARQY
jgi:hypothetical protein